MRKVYARCFVSRENCDTQRVSHRRVVCYPVSRENHLQTNSQELRITLNVEFDFEQDQWLDKMSRKKFTFPWKTSFPQMNDLLLVSKNGKWNF